MSKKTKGVVETVEEVTEKTTQKFSKKQLLSVKKFADRKDALGAVLEDKDYTVAESEEILNKFMKGKVK